MKSKIIDDKPGERVFVVAFEVGEEPMKLLSDFVTSARIHAARFTAIGAFSEVVLGFFDLEKKDYKRTRLPEQVEVLSVVGNVALHQNVPKIHAHVVVGKQDGSAWGGHLLEARVQPTLEVVLTESPGYLERFTDAATGLPLLSVK